MIGTLGLNLSVLVAASAFPNLLMEPEINGDLTHSVAPQQDLTFPMLRDIGW